MNHVVFRPAIPVSAVPVLPATVKPEIWAAVPVPSSTASFIIAPTARAVSGLIARSSTSGFERTSTRPSGATIRSITCGFITTPSFAIVAATIAICSGVTSSRSCPNASRPGSTSVSSAGSKSFVPL